VGLLDFLEKVAAEGDFIIVGLHTDPVSRLDKLHVIYRMVVSV
jgi:hypothetical protein